MFLEDGQIQSSKARSEFSDHEKNLLAELRQPDPDNRNIQESLRELRVRHGLRAISALTDQGSCTEAEDGMVAVVDRGILGVFDAMSNVHYGNIQKEIVYGRTSGECVRSIVTSEIAMAEAPLWDSLQNANAGVASFHSRRGINLSDTPRLAGVVGAVVQLSPTAIECYQWGDCFALWKYTNGKLGMTPSQFTTFDATTRGSWEEAASRNSGDPRATWAEVGPFFAEQRSRFVNKVADGGFGFLNGQPEFLKSLQHFILPREELRYLILMSDTLVKGLEELAPDVLATRLAERYESSGIGGIYLPPRIYEENHQNSHIPGRKGEATAIAIEF